MFNVIVNHLTELATPQEIIEEARNGRMFILVDDETRENEGDLIIPAQMATPESIAFMAREGRGLICLAMEASLIDRLNLPLMGQQQTRMQTAFTVSIEAREGVTTGISAADRAHTVQVAIAADARPDDIVTPGHVFPLRAREGGVLVRAGHTEAAVDIARLAGLRPAAVICEVMKEDGTMARLPDLIPYAKAHGLKIGTIADLIAFRRQHENIIERVSSSSVVTKWGNDYTLHIYRHTLDGTEHLALVKGNMSKTP
jgi:3,4-dihydroxy 2-butanone 4-phosphate synthase / GTP cyclohydrolase II